MQPAAGLAWGNLINLPSIISTMFTASAGLEPERLPVDQRVRGLHGPLEPPAAAPDRDHHFRRQGSIRLNLFIY